MISMLLFPLYLAGLQILSCTNYIICGTTNTPSLILASLILGILLVKYINPALL